MNDWKEYEKLVMSNLADHEKRIERLEESLLGLRLEMNKLLMRYSFMGSLGGSLCTLIPVILTWYFTKK